MAPSIPIQPQHTSSSPVTKRKVPRKKSKKGLLIAIAIVLILVILVQNFAYPFLLQKVTGGVVSTLAVSTVKPEQEMDETVNPDQETVGTVSAAETRSVRSYAASIKNSYSWQLSGTEKSLFGRLNDKLKSTSQNSGAKEVGLLDVGSVLTAYAANGAAENPVATEVANIASVLSLYGYDKLSLALLAAAVEGNPLDPTIVNNMACSLRSQGHLQDSLKLLSYAYKLAPADIDIRINLGNTNLDMGNLEHANLWFSSALDFDNDYGPAHEGLMLCYMAEKNYRVAMRHMIKAAKNCYTPALQKVYNKISNLEDYEDIRDDVLKGFSMADIAETYQRKRKDSGMDGIDVPANLLRIPNFPAYPTAEVFMANVKNTNDFAMSLISPGLDQLKELDQILKQAEDLIGGLQSGGLGGLLETMKGDSEQQENPGVEGGNLTLSLSYEREQFTMNLLGDYLDMKVDELTEEMDEKLANIENDPLMDALARSERELDNRGDNEEAWLNAMKNNWGNSFALSNSTIHANQVNINQHLNAFYQTVVPTYNDLKPELEEYWMRTAGIVKYVGNEQLFKALSLERKIKVTGNLATFGSLALIECINVPTAYASVAVGGDAQPPQDSGSPEKLDMPKDEEKSPEKYVSIGIEDVVSIEISDSEVSAEFALLVRAGISYNMEKGTTTLTAGTGGSTGALVPGVGGGASECYYWTFKGTSVTDHGYISKYSYNINASIANVGTSYTATYVSKVSNVTHAVEKTVEKAVAGNLGIGSFGLKK
ncbi:MAG: hypothetical protein GX115_00730 [Ruminiclostridium sp.]|nr:hypothetical protein [Ruminiclostridium sp.]